MAAAYVTARPEDRPIARLVARLVAETRDGPGLGEAEAARAASTVDGLLEVLADIARNADELAADLLGFSRLMSDDTLARALHPELSRALSTLRDLEDQLESQIEPYLHAQLEARGIRPGDRGLKLDITGGVPAPGWVRVGAEHADVFTNLLWSLPFHDGAARYIYFALAIEHFHRSDVPALLRELRRVLCDGGVLRVVTTDLGKYLQAHAEGDRAFLEGQWSAWPWTRDFPTTLDSILAWAGAGRRPGDFADHKWGYDEESLGALLLTAGFSAVRSSSYMGSEHAELRVDTRSRDAGVAHDGRTYALFMEATA